MSPDCRGSLGTGVLVENDIVLSIAYRSCLYLEVSGTFGQGTLRTFSTDSRAQVPGVRRSCQLWHFSVKSRESTLLYQLLTSLSVAWNCAVICAPGLSKGFGEQIHW